MNIFVVADFDETLIEQNTLMEVYRNLADKPLACSVMSAFLRGRWVRNGARSAIKEEIYRVMLRGKQESELTAVGRTVARGVTLNGATVAQVRRITNQGHDLVVASAALAPIVQSILEEKGLEFTQVVATQAEVSEGRLTGELINGECFGKVKARRIKRIREASYRGARMVAFGNWPDDRPMLNEADEAYIVIGNTINIYKKNGML